MKTLFFGAGPIGRLYAYRFYKAGKDVTILARNTTYNFIEENGIVLVDGYTGEKDSAKVNVVDKLFQSFFSSRHAEVGIGMHANAIIDEVKELADDFKTLIDKTSIKTPNFDKLISFFP